MVGKRTAEEWTAAALVAIAKGGIAAVSVERLARELGVTKGSFYWHFADRAALVESAVLYWEQVATDEVIERLSQVIDPEERLRQLLLMVFSDLEHGPIDVALAARADDEIVGPVIRRVTARRVSFVASIFGQLGLTPARAERQARMALASYMGHFQLRAAMPQDKYLAKPTKAYVEQLLASFLP